jgi:hypothetical protein
MDWSTRRSMNAVNAALYFPAAAALSVIVPYRPTCTDICLPIRYPNELFRR